MSDPEIRYSAKISSRSKLFSRTSSSMASSLPKTLPGGSEQFRSSHDDTFNEHDSECEIDVFEKSNTQPDGEGEYPQIEYESINTTKTSVWSRGKHYASICKRMSVFLIIRFGLTCFVIIYAAIGGFVFQHLERRGEELERINIALTRDNTMLKLWNMTQNMDDLDFKDWSPIATEILREFQTDVFTAVKKYGWNGREEEEAGSNWSTASAILFSITVLTTIGYGHVTPKTTEGRLVMMLFALVGIPITLLWITTLGASWAKRVRSTYKKICEYSAKHVLRKGRKVHIIDGQIVEPPVKVPIYISLLLVNMYVIAGAFIFNLMEDDWTFVIAGYFCFVTLTTIGFGDYVFGIGKEADSPPKLLASAVYLLLGLSVVVMCFDLVQEDIKLKSRGIGVRLGLVHKEPVVKARVFDATIGQIVTLRSCV